MVGNTILMAHFLKIPSTNNNLIKNADINSYNVKDDGGFIWLVNSLNDTLPSSYCNELYDNNWVKVYGSKTLKGNIFDWIMNAVDISHINYVHDFANEKIMVWSLI